MWRPVTEGMPKGNANCCEHLSIISLKVGSKTNNWVQHIFVSKISWFIISIKDLINFWTCSKNEYFSYVEEILKKRQEVLNLIPFYMINLQMMVCSQKPWPANSFKKYRRKQIPEKQGHLSTKQAHLVWRWFCNKIEISPFHSFHLLLT